jgi:SAM-dependent methyltransferase
MKLAFQLTYLVGFKPWDRGVPWPELTSMIEGPEALQPGRALDLGCGTGTHAIYLAQHGWDVTAIDLVERPLKKARRKAAGAGVSPSFICGDVTRLSELDVGGDYGFVVDVGCFHTLPEDRRDAYAAEVTAATTKGATLLLCGLVPGSMVMAWRGVSADELRQRLPGWELRDAIPGSDPLETFWYRMERTS